MRRLLNTLYATTEGAWLRAMGPIIVMEVERQVRARLPVHVLESLVCIGRILFLQNCSVSTPTGHFLLEVIHILMVLVTYDVSTTTDAGVNVAAGG